MISLAGIVGQDQALGRLRDAMAAGRLPHALLFAGPEGVGKETTAAALAKTLLCEKPVGGPGAIDACGRCESCRMMDSSSHGDYHVIYKELARYHPDTAVRSRKMQELGIDVIDHFLLSPACRAAIHGRGKVFVVRQAELMSTEAQNSLLKTLEEPPAGVTIILLSAMPDDLLPTTLSRCWMLRFGLLSEAFVTQRLADAGVSGPEAAFWSAFTSGSAGRALELAQAGVYEIKRDMLERLAALPATGDAEAAEHFSKLTDKLADVAIKAVKDADGATLSATLAGRTAAGAMLELIASMYRDAMRLRLARDAGADAPSLVHADQTEAIEALAKRFEPSQDAEIIEQLSDFETLLWRNVSAKIVWDNVIITCASAAALPMG